MNRELLTLLRVIGTDEEYGTHGAASMDSVLADAIRTGKDVHNLFPRVRLDKGAQYAAVVGAIPLFNQMSESAFRRLLNFTNDVGFVNADLGRRIRDECVLPAHCKEQLGKRASFLQTFSRVRPKIFTLGDLREEEQVRAKYPWQWIDAANEIYSPAAQAEMANQLVVSDDLRPFYLRVPDLRDTKGREYLDKVLQVAKGRLTPAKYGAIRTKVRDIIHRRE
jgi:hypothetical protein